MDSRIDLQQPVLDGGIRSINFFNGRLLSARDLTREQTAQREADRRLGLAVGEGIAYGLEVTKASGSTKESPAVSVTAGLAINRLGHTLMLPARTDITLVRSPGGNGTAKLFGECLPLQTGTYVAGAGVYLLTVAPAQGVEGRATTNGLNPAMASCNTDAVVSAVQFRLIQINPPVTAAELQDESHLRNLIAYKCLGISDTNAFMRDPFGELKQFGLLDSLRPNQLTECEVPLAILYWTLEGGLKFIDMWSVRRRMARQSSGKRWDLALGDRSAAEGEARFQQFQDQMETLRLETVNPQSIVASQHFHHLPPVGVMPMQAGNSPQGFDYLQFFSGLTYREPVYIEGATVAALIRKALGFAPIDLSTKEMLWVYRVRENMQAFAAGGPGLPQPFMVFTSGHVGFAGDAHFDLSHWSFSNYSA